MVNRRMWRHGLSTYARGRVQDESDEVVGVRYWTRLRISGVVVTLQADLTAELGVRLKPMGYRKRRYNWYRLGPNLYSVVNVQKSDWGDRWYLNIGFAGADQVPSGWRPSHQCGVGFRAESIKSIPVESLHLLAGELRQSLGADAWREAVAEQIVAPLAEILEQAHDVDGLKQVLRQHVNDQVALYLDGQRLLGDS